MDTDLTFFVAESNRIEGIRRAPTPEELDAHERFLSLTEVTVTDLCDFVRIVAQAKLRAFTGMDVQVGSYAPSPGGPFIFRRLQVLLRDAHTSPNPYAIHVRYEALHPFMDGNGRSGRVLWLWMMERAGHTHARSMGFLHLFYYQALEYRR